MHLEEMCWITIDYMGGTVETIPDVFVVIAKTSSGESGTLCTKKILYFLFVILPWEKHQGFTLICLNQHNK